MCVCVCVRQRHATVVTASQPVWTCAPSGDQHTGRRPKVFGRKELPRAAHRVPTGYAQDRRARGRATRPLGPGSHRRPGGDQSARHRGHCDLCDYERRRWHVSHAPGGAAAAPDATTAALSAATATAASLPTRWRHCRAAATAAGANWLATAVAAATLALAGAKPATPKATALAAAATAAPSATLGSAAAQCAHQYRLPHV